MHLKTYFTTAAMLFVLLLHAQNYIPVKTVPAEIFRSVNKPAPDTPGWKWKSGGVLNLNLSQGSLSNWAAGGDKFTLAVNSYFNYYLLNKGAKHTWDNNADVFLGFIKTSSLGTRKNDDRIDVISKYGYKIDSTEKWYASALFNFRSQFFDGHTYNNDSGFLSSTFLSPAYIIASAGFDYKPVNSFSLFMSPFTNRTTIVASDRLYSQSSFGVPPNKHAINQTGVFASVNYNKTLVKNVTYKGRMDLFSDYGHNPQNVDMFFTNILNFKVNKYLSATYNLDMMYDDDVRLFGKYSSSPALQLKSLIGIGFSMPIDDLVN